VRRPAAALLLALLVAWSPAHADDGEEPTPADEAPPKKGPKKQAGPPTDRPTRAVILPSTSFNPDDGFGAGLFGGIERVRPPDEEPALRPHVWNIDLVARLWLRPVPRGWELYSGLSWFPWPGGRTEGAWVLSSNGFSSDWWFAPGMGRARDRTRHDPETEEVRDLWHRFSLYQVRSNARIFHNVAGPLRLLGGVGFQLNWTGVREQTLLAEMAPSLEYPGLGGSGYVTLEAGVQVDTRDIRIDPTSGGTITGVIQANVGDIDGPGGFGRAFFDLRGYLGTPGGEVVFAAELAVQAAFGEVPFHELGVLAGFESRPRTLTGVTGLRGQDRGRIRGPLTLLAHGEVRFRPPGFNLIRTFFVRLEPAIWADAARADEYGVTPEGPALLPGFGGGIRAVFNELSLVRLDVGTGPDPTLTADGLETRWAVKAYGTVQHSF